MFTNCQNCDAPFVTFTFFPHSYGVCSSTLVAPLYFPLSVRLSVCLSTFSTAEDNPVAAILFGGVEIPTHFKAVLNTIRIRSHTIKLHICSIQAEQMCSVVCWHLKCANQIIASFRYVTVNSIPIQLTFHRHKYLV